MENLNRKAILRMWSGKAGNSSSVGGGGDIDLTGYATSIWVTQNFVSIDFFRELFKAYDSNGNEVLPNDTETTINNIKAMFGFWTEQYLSALGQGSGGGGGGGAEALSDLLDVDLTTLQNGQALIYSSAIGKWTNGTAGVNMTQVWSALDSATNEQINVSHLTNALSGYVTQTWVTNNYLTQTAASSTYLTQTAASETYLSKADAASTYLTQTAASSTYLSIAFFDRLFQAYAGTGSSAVRVNPNDTTSTIDNIKAMFGFWTEKYISALGQGTGGGGGGVGDVTWDLLANNSDTRQIALSHLTTALSGYALTSQLPTKVSQLTNDSGFITSLGDCFRYQGLVTNDYVTGTTYSTITNGSYQRQLSGASDSLLHFQIGGSASGLDIRFSYQQDNSNPLQYRKCIDSNRFAGGWVTLIDSLNIGSQSVSYATSSGSATKLSTARTIWGQSFDGTDNVSGNMTGVGTISASGDMTITKSSGGADIAYIAKGKTYTMWFGIGSGDTNRGIYGLTSSKWLLYFNESNTILNYGNVGIGTTSPSYKLHVAGTVGTSDNILVEKSDGWIGVKSSGANENYLFGAYDVGYIYGSVYGHYLNFQNGVTTVCNTLNINSASVPVIRFTLSSNTGNIRMKSNNEFYFYKGTGDSQSDATWVDAYGFYAYGAVTALSDARDKTVIGDVKLSVDEIANAPAILFLWNDGRDDKSRQTGSIAQYWRSVLPECVQEKDDRLSLSYGVAALVSSIVTARKVVDHERRIKELEEENKKLKLKLKIA